MTNGMPSATADQAPVLGTVQKGARSKKRKIRVQQECDLKLEEHGSSLPRWKVASRREEGDGQTDMLLPIADVGQSGKHSNAPSETVVLGSNMKRRRLPEEKVGLPVASEKEERACPAPAPTHSSEADQPKAISSTPPGSRKKGSRRTRRKPLVTPPPPPRWWPGAHVEAAFGNAWYPALVESCCWTLGEKGPVYRVFWEGENAFTEGLAEDELREGLKLALPSATAKAERTRGGTAASGCRTIESCPLAGEVCGPVAEGAAAPPSPCARSEAGPLAGVEEETEEALAAEAMNERLHTTALVELREGLPWEWGLFDFVEEYFARFEARVVQELERLRPLWMPQNLYVGARPGAFAAAKVSERLAAFGLAVYAPPPSVSEEPPYLSTGPRFYVSVTQAAFARHGQAPCMPRGLLDVLWPHQEDRTGTGRVRGLGWTLAPPGSDPQDLHADIWGGEEYPKSDRVRFPHIIWKPRARICEGGAGAGPPRNCTTQLVLGPGGFTSGQFGEEHYRQLAQAAAPAVLMDSEVLHRGAQTAAHSSSPHADAKKCSNGGTRGWVSSLSVELCSPTGWLAWEAGGTGGTEDDGEEDEYAMLPIATDPSLAPHTSATVSRPGDEGGREARQLRAARRKAKGLVAGHVSEPITSTLEVLSSSELRTLKREQRKSEEQS